jgi:hypothetical protein
MESQYYIKSWSDDVNEILLAWVFYEHGTNPSSNKYLNQMCNYLLVKNDSAL